MSSRVSGRAQVFEARRFFVVIVVMLLVSPVGLGGLLYLLDIVRPFKKAVLTVAIGASSLVFLITAACVAWMLTEGCRAAP